MYIYGNLEYCGSIYPFVLDNRIVRIIGNQFQYVDNFSEFDEVDSINGITSNNTQICFLKCRFIKSFFGQSCSFSIQGYALSTNNVGIPCDFTYNASFFSADAINAFFSPQKTINIDMNTKDWDGSIGIHLTPFSETTTCFNYLNARCKFEISRYVRIRKEPRSIGEVNTLFSFNYRESRPLIKIIDDYLALYDFLSFVNFSTNIPLTDINICKMDDQNNLIKTATIHIFNDKDEYENTDMECITFDDIPTDKIEVLFTRIASLRKLDSRFNFYFPENKDDARFVDSGKWLITALNFEGLFNVTFPSFKQSSNESFRKAKDLIIKKIDNVFEDEFSSKKEADYYKKCREQIERYEGLLEEKLNYAIKTNSIVLERILKTNEQKYQVHTHSNYGSFYAAYRNKIAHGSIEPLSNNEVATYRIIQPLIYTMLLSNLDLQKNEIKTIIEKLFK